ncbi:3'-5' exonuclease [Salidesulfovibrio brasiliensis]|uniref:3'-5' exonuclease n=1 Tax=Salidesulfovibrio brasiliensis TaxID=221711 RepID=UPI0006CF49FA|nr:3'-5' exonuclease [Salidesulfovibrio brasiliensis]
MHTVETLRYVAIDFETADPKRDSACSVGLVVVEGGRIIDKAYRLIRPPRKRFNPYCQAVHGLCWNDVCEEPPFAESWPEMLPLLEGADFMCAHNAAFDSSVLRACCDMAGHPYPSLPFLCTVQLARRTWALPKNKLPIVCEHLGIELDHHNALSDAEACARIAAIGLAENPGFLERIL